MIEASINPGTNKHGVHEPFVSISSAFHSTGFFQIWWHPTPNELRALADQMDRYLNEAGEAQAYSQGAATS